MNLSKKTALKTQAPQQAVQDYLDALLQEVTEAPEPAAPEALVREPPPPAPVAPKAPERSWAGGRPRWAAERFECLLFKVSGLTLAVPLVELGGVVTLEEAPTPLFGQPDWYLGLLPCRGDGTIRVIDTARWVMPERCTDEAREGLRFVIRLEATDWGLACHEVADAITLEPDQVRWRTDRSRRPWLAGTVIEQMCAILDPGALAQLIQQQIKAPG